jgi:hypothetical protein
VVIQEFVDWQPPQYYTARATIAEGITLLSTHEIEPVEGGAVLHERFAAADTEEGRALQEALLVDLEAGHRIEVVALGDLLSKAAAEAGAVDEPPLPEADPARRLATTVS